MNLLGLFNSRWLLYGAPVLLVLGIALYWRGYTVGVAREVDRQATAQLAVERAAAQLLATRTAQVRETEARNRALATELEVAHVQHTTEVEAALADNRRLAAANRGLRDPGRRPACPDPLRGATAPAGSIAGGPTESGLPEAGEGLLSAEASELILELAADADRAALYANTCHRWVRALKEKGR